MTKTQLFAVSDVVVTPNTGVNTFTLDSFDPISLVIETNRNETSLTLMRQSYDTSKWYAVTDGNGVIKLNDMRSEVVLASPGVYALVGKVVGSALAYTITV